MRAFSYAVRVGVVAFSVVALPLKAEEVVQHGQIEEILVTAQKRTESVMDVPISINVVTGATIEEFQFTEMRDLDDLVPNLRVSKSAASDAITMRGVGSAAGNLTVEQSVAMFVDGVYGGRSHQWQNPLFDVERVEVLRGPQGALVGKNTLAGALNIITRKPRDEFEAEIRVSRDFDMDGFSGTAIVSGAVTDRLALRLSAQYEDTDGWVDNPAYNGREEPSRESTLVRLTGVLDATDNVRITAKLEYSEFDESGCFYETKGPADPLKLTYRNACNGFENQAEYDNTESPNATIQVDWDLGGYALTSITGYSSYEADKLIDGDFGELPNLGALFVEDYDQISQEVRLLSPIGRRFEYILGAYYHQWDLMTDRVTLFNAFGPFDGSISRRGDQDDWVASAFGQGTWHISDTLRLNGSLRYTHEDKEGFMTRTAVGVVPGLTTDFGQTRKENHWDPSASLQWNATDRVMLFTSFASGSKGGGFTADSSAVTPADFQFEDETSESYEIGVKYDGELVSLQLVGYWTNFDNQQVSIYDSSIPLFVTENVGKSRSRGIELEGRWQATQNLSIGGSLAYLDAYYTYWPDGTCLYPNDSDSTCREDRSGSPFDVPEWEGALNASYLRSLTPDWNLVASAAMVYQSDDMRFQNPRCELDGYIKLHARVGAETSNGRWSVNLTGRNLTDKATYSACPNTPLRPGYLTYNTEPPRQVILELAYRWM